MDRVQAQIGTLDIAVIAAYLAIVLLIGIWVARRTSTGEDLFLAGRSLAWGAIGLSLFASNISTTTLMGLTGAAYSSGIATSAFEWMAGIPLLLLAFIFAPLFLKARITTTPEWLDLRYSRPVRLYFSGLTILFTVIVDTAGGLYAGGVVMTTFFPEVPLWLACGVIGLFAGGYAAAGGLKAVVYTDVLQAVVLIAGCGITALILFGELDYSWARVTEALPEGHLSMVRPIGDPDLPWTGLVAGIWLLGFWYWVTNQYIVQRALGARSVPDAQRGALLGGLLKILPLFLMVLPGAMAAPLLPDIPEPDQVFPVMITTVLPVGLTGLVLAGLIAAIMSTVDSTLNAASALIINDFATPSEQRLAPRKARRWGTLCTLTLMVVAVIWAPLIQFAGGIWDYLQQAFSIIVPPVVALFVYGALSRRPTGRAALRTLLSMHALGVALFVLAQLGVWPLHFTETVTVVTILSFVVLHLLSRPGGPAPDPSLIWTPADALAGRADDATPAIWDVRLWGAILAAAMGAVLIWFW